jgi:diguanylate cyclase (GGDEF)-like protein
MPRGFRERLLLALVVLVVGPQLIGGYAVLETVREDSLEKASADLEVGRRVFSRMLESRTGELLESVRVLAADFGFKSAVGTRDTATITSALDNHAARIGADLIILVDNAGERIAATRGLGSRSQAAFPGLRAGAQRRGEATAVAVVGDQLVQLVAVPVRAPVPIAWAMMGFRVDQALAGEMSELTGLEVSFVARDEDGEALVSTLDAPDRAQLSATIDEPIGGVPFYGPDGRYLTALVELPMMAPARGVAALQMPAESITSAYRTLQLQFLVILLLAAGLSLVVGIVFAGGISRPVARLIAASRRIREGDYTPRVEVRSGGELALLADALNDMSAGIAEREERIRHQASHDDLTGLPNRRYIEQEIERRLQEGRRFALLLLSVDGFRAINDALGYDTGDRVLRMLADRLRTTMRPDTLIARIGGDEFLVVMEEASADQALRRAGEVRPALCEIMEVEGSPVAVGLSIGVVATPEHGRDTDRLLRRADIALGRAKREAGPIRVYEPGEDEQHLRELRLLRDLRVALDQGGLSIRYQPKVRTRDARVDQVEALVRWQHPELGAIGPDEFVFLAERSGLVQRLTASVVAMALDDLAAWRAAGRDLMVCINLSAHDLADPRLPEMLQHELERRSLCGRDLVLEITESALLEDPEGAVQVLEALRALGIDLAVDDFGTGYSSLAQLRRLPVTELKIDKSFVLELEHSRDDRLIVRSTIALGHALGLSVVAEGLESAASWALLESYQCDRVQGFHLARPMLADELDVWLDAWRPDAAKAAVAASRAVGADPETTGPEGE